MKNLLLFTVFILFSGSINAQSWVEKQKIVASDRAPWDNFGGHIGGDASISGDYAIVGLDDKDYLFTTNVGAAYVYERDASGNWLEVQKLVPSDLISWGYFGCSVSISGNYLVVGANDDYYGSPSDGGEAAYVFERDASGTWIEVQKLVASDGVANDAFGCSVSISGDYIIVGAGHEAHDVNGLNYINGSGSGYVFERDASGTWNEVQKIVASDRAAGADFGGAVSISDDRIVVGAYCEAHNVNGLDSLYLAGAAYIFERDASGNWNEVQKIVASDREMSDQFGLSVSISGDYIVAGAPNEAEDVSGGNTLAGAGSAYVFERNASGTWNEVQKIVNSDRATVDRLGYSVSISGDYIVAGAPYEDHNPIGLDSLRGSGSAYIFERKASGTWNEVQKIVNSDRNVADHLGISLAISNNYIIVTAPYQSYNAIGLDSLIFAGAAYIFEDLCTSTDTSFDVLACTSYTVPSNDETYTTVGTYPVMDTIPNSCGKDSVMMITVTVTGYPIITGALTTCVGATTQLSTTQSITSVNWSSGTPGVATISSNGLVTGVSAGITEIISSYGVGCSTTDTVTVNPLPVVDFVVDHSQSCVGTDQVFLFSPVSGINDSVLTWNFGDGTEITNFNSNVGGVSYAYPDVSGVYDVTLTVSTTVASGECSNSLTKPAFISIFENPTADFTMTPNPTKMSDPTIHFYDESTSGTSVIENWVWNISGVDFSNSEDFSYEFPQDTGYYLVRLVITDANGCMDTITRTAIVNGELEIFIPNSFTPDGDGLNDEFLPITSNNVKSKDYAFYVFNRWGELLFESYNLQNGWNGTFKGDFVPNGVYVWKVEITDLEGISKKYTGHVSVIR